jgi:hypothetical protein
MYLAGSADGSHERRIKPAANSPHFPQAFSSIAAISTPDRFPGTELFILSGA